MANLVKNQKGQLIIEAVLLMVVMMALFLTFSKYMKENKVVQNLVQGSWQKVAGMIETGNWKEVGLARKLHPNSLNDVASKKCGASEPC